MHGINYDSEEYGAWIQDAWEEIKKEGFARAPYTILGLLVGGLVGGYMGGRSGALVGGVLGGLAGYSTDEDPEARLTVFEWEKNNHPI